MTSRREQLRDFRTAMISASGFDSMVPNSCRPGEVFSVACSVLRPGPEQLEGIPGNLDSS
jgi:hypothetical protein